MFIINLDQSSVVTAKLTWAATNNRTVIYTRAAVSGSN